jgi:hypothetical protein
MTDDDDGVTIETEVSSNVPGDTLRVNVQNQAVATYLHACEEARKTINQQITWNQEIDDKAARLLRINTALAALVGTAFSILIQFADASPNQPSVVLSTTPWVDGLLLVGSVCFLLSTLTAGITYTRSDLIAGIRSTDIQRTIDEDMDLTDFYEELAVGYRKWEQRNRSHVDRNGLFLNVSISLLLYSLVMFAAAVVAKLGHVAVSLGLAFLAVVVLTIAIRLNPPHEDFSSQEAKEAI